MKGSCGASLRSLMASSSRPRGKSSFAHSARSLTSVAASVKSFASVSRRDNASDAEGSRASSVDPADIFQPPRERMTHRQTEEEAFKKNLKEVQAWRRGRAATYQKTPFIPKMKDESLPKPQVEPSNSDLALSTLLASGAALGCSSAKINPHFAHYVYGNRAGLSIIDLDQTLPLLRRAANVVRDVVKNDGVVLFVGHRPLLKKSLEKAKGRLGDNGYTTTRWTPGVLTNAESFFGLPAMQDGSYLPDLVVFLHPGDCSHGVRECTNRNVPTIGVVDSDTDPRMVTYPIPANIQSIRTSELVLGALSVAGAEGRRLRIQEEELRAARQKALKQRAERAAGSEQAAYRSRPGR